MRLPLFAAVALCAFLSLQSHAAALSEFCPARADQFHRIGDVGSTLYSFTVSAEGPRSVQGRIAVRGDDSWYLIDFPKTQLSAYHERWRDAYVEYTRTTFASAVLYVRFPSPIARLDAFTYDAQSFGDPAFGWDAQGLVGCSAPAGFGLAYGGSKGSVLTLLNPRTDLAEPPVSNADVLTARLTSPPGRLDCAVPFANARATEAAAPVYPLGSDAVATLVYVEIVVDKDGSLADAWIYAPSGRKPFDDAALEAARKSTFAPGTAFCGPAPGSYLFRAEFNPR
jgi:TonB family protein